MTMEDNRPSVYVDDEAGGLVVYRASALGQCSSILLEHRYGDNEPLPHPQWLLDRFEAGKRNESVILEKFYDPKAGRTWRTMGGAQLEVELPVGEGVVVRGHLDDIAMRVAAINDTVTTPVGEHRVVEAKKFGPSYMDTWRDKGLSGFPLYEFQLSIYMHATGLGAVFVVGASEPSPDAPDDRAKDVVRRVEVKLIDEPPVSMGQIKLKVARIEAMYQRGERFDKCDVNTYPCPFYHLLHDNPPKSAGQQQMEERLQASVLLSQLDVPAEMLSRGARMMAEGESLKQHAKEMFAEWQQNYPSITDSELRTRRWKIRRGVGGEVEWVRPIPEQEREPEVALDKWMREQR